MNTSDSQTSYSILRDAVVKFLEISDYDELVGLFQESVGNIELIKQAVIDTKESWDEMNEECKCLGCGKNTVNAEDGEEECAECKSDIEECI